MSDQTSNLSLPYIQAAQAQKHVTHNEAIELLDMVVQLTLEAVTATTPPNNAAEGQAWAIGAGASGAWAGYTGHIAAWRGGGWLIIEPKVGWRAFDKATQTIRVYMQTGWEIPTSGTPDLDNLDGVGINASSDATNRLSISSPATLLNHEGAGHQLKINKATTADTASLLYQSNWSGRAEIGLSGNDDLSVKVSDDGSAFVEALRIDKSSGTVTMPTTGQRQLLPLNYQYFLYTDRRWMGHSPNSATQNAWTSLGSDTDPSVYWAAKGIFLPAGTILRSFTLAGNVSDSDVLDIDFEASFQHGPWGAGWTSAVSTTSDVLHRVDDIDFSYAGGMQRITMPLNFVTPNDGYFLGAARHGSTSTLAAIRYLHIAGCVDVILPPMVT